MVGFGIIGAVFLALCHWRCVISVVSLARGHWRGVIGSADKTVAPQGRNTASHVQYSYRMRFANIAICDFLSATEYIPSRTIIQP